MTDEHVDLLAQTMFAGFYSDAGPDAHRRWDDASTITRGHWRRAARAAVRTLSGNMHWFGDGEGYGSPRPTGQQKMNPNSTPTGLITTAEEPGQ